MTIIITANDIKLDGVAYLQPDWTSFFAYETAADDDITDGSAQKTLIDTIDFDLRGEFNISTNTFTADQGGIYEFGGSVRFSGVTAGMRGFMSLNIETVSVVRMFGHFVIHGAEQGGAQGGSVIIELNAGDDVYLEHTLFGSGGTADMSVGIERVYFWGKKIRERIT